MKIGTAVSPDIGRTEVTPRGPQRAKPTPAGGQGPKSAAAGDRLELSAQATSVRSAEDATRLARETRDLIAQNNREAVVAQPVDVGRLLALVG